MTEKTKNWWTSLWTDREWDADLTKVAGFVITIVGLIGWWQCKPDFQWVVGFGIGAMTSGKFSKEG